MNSARMIDRFGLSYPKPSRRGVAILGMAAGLVLAGVSQAATYTWTQSTAGTYNWSDAGNWSGGVVPANNTAGIVNLFVAGNSLSGAYATTQNATGASSTLTLNQLNLNGRGNPSTSTFTITAGGGIVFEGANAAFNANPQWSPSNLTYNVNVPLRFNVDTAIHYGSLGGYLTLGTPALLSGSGNLTLSNSNTTADRKLVFRAPSSTYTGHVNVQSGVTSIALASGASNAFGPNTAGTQTIAVASGARLEISNSWNQFNRQNLVLNGPGVTGSESSGAFFYSGDVSQTSSIGGVAMASDSAITVNAGTVQLLNATGQSNGVLVGTGNLTKRGNGTLRLNNTSPASVTWNGSTYNRYTGDVSVLAGVLRLGNVHEPLGLNTSGTQAVTVSSGAAVIFDHNNGAFRVPQNFLIAGAGTSGSGNAALQALSLNFNNAMIGALVLTGNATVSVNRNSAAVDTRGLQVNGALAGTGNLTLTATTIGTNTGTTYLNAPSAAVGGYPAYSGMITVLTGRLQVAADDALGTGSVTLSSGSRLVLTGGTLKDYFDDALGTLTIPSGMAPGSVSLNFVGTDLLSSVSLNGITYTAGSFGAIGSGATIQDAVFTGTGILAIPEPGLAASVIAAFGVLLRRRSPSGT